MQTRPRSLRFERFIQSFRQSVPALLAVVLGCTLCFRGLLNADPSQTLWADQYDARLLYWIFMWGYHVLVEIANPLEFWNANSFYPHSGSLAFSDGLLGAQLFFIPFRLIGFAPLSALYLSLTGIATLGGLASNRGLLKLGFHSDRERFIIIFGAHFALSTLNFFQHYQMWGVHIAIAALIYVLLWLRDGEPSELVRAVALFFFANSIALYCAPMLLSIAFFLGIVMLACYRSAFVKKLLWPWFDARVRMQRLQAFAAICAMALIFWIVIGSHYDLAEAGAHNAVALSRSARPLGFILDPSPASLWYGPQRGWGSFERSAGALFPGFILLLGMVGLLATACRSAHTPKKFDLNEPDSTLAIMLLALVCAVILLAMGPAAGDLPRFFNVMSYLVPGLGDLRAPGRFGMFLALPCAFGVVWLLRWVALQHRAAVQLVAACALIIESLPFFRIYPLTVGDQGIYTRMAQYIAPKTPLLELPVASFDALRQIRRITFQLRGSSEHWARLVSGYGARSSPELDALLALDLQLQQGNADIGGVEAFARKLGIEHMLVHVDRYPKNVRLLWRAWLSRMQPTDPIGGVKRAAAEGTSVASDARILLRYRRSVLVQLR